MFCYECKTAKKYKSYYVSCSLDGLTYHETHKCHINAEDVIDMTGPHSRLMIGVHAFNEALVHHSSPQSVLNVVNEIETSVKELQKYLREKVGT